MTEIKDSNVAIGGSTIKGVVMDKSKNENTDRNITINSGKRKIFGLGFISGVLASLAANFIWQFIHIKVLAFFS